jgi:MinD-like ATPase involved in chromosome partitioning or flagellar assembly
MKGVISMSVLVFGEKDFVSLFDGRFPAVIAGTARDLPAAMQVLRDASGADDVVVGFEGQDGIDFAFRLAELHRDKRIYLAPTVTTPELWARAFTSGIKIVSRDGLPLSVAQVLPVSEKPAAKLVTMYALNGGSGKSTITSGVACCAALKKDVRVCVVSAASNRAQCVFQGLRVPISAPQNMESIGAVDWDSVQSQLVRPYPDLLPDLCFLPGPMDSPRDVSVELLRRILGILDEHFDLILFDVSDQLKDDATFLAVQSSSLVFLLVRAEMPQVIHVGELFIPKLHNFNINTLRLLVTWVWPGEDKVFAPSRVAEDVGRGMVRITPFERGIPLDKAVHDNYNDPYQLPLVVANPKCPFSLAIYELTSYILKS